MSKKIYSLLPLLFVAFLTLQSLLLVFSQPQDFTAAVEESSPVVEGLQISLGHDSPNLGGNVFRDAYIALTLSDTLGVKAAKIVNEVSFPNTGEIAFERAELTPDVETAGATLEAETETAEGEMVTVRITISSTAPLPNGIIANLVFTVIKEFTLDEVGNEEHLIPLENKVTAWSSDDQEITQVVSDRGGVDLAYAPVVFACFFYMH
ncbi:hypothetical protein MYX82_14720 [Acidobacteria bacterium AH-259-D05]|nr:hypothetical protein [Acidobacteria bacterium AH-259-D05]